MKKRNDYLDFGVSYSNRKRKHTNGYVFAVILVIILALGSGLSVFYLTDGNLGSSKSAEGLTEFLNIAKNTPPALIGEAGKVTPGAEKNPEVTLTPTPTPEPTATPTPVYVYVEPDMNTEDYLLNWVDNREKIDVKGIYGGTVSLKNPKLKSFLELADDTEMNAVVINVKEDSGYITYYMDCAAAEEAGTLVGDIDDMPGLLKALHEHGIYAIARIVCFKDNVTFKSHPEWYLYKKDGSIYVDTGGAKWMNPYNEEACKYIIDIAAQAAADGFDEICFDYIRTSTSYINSVDFGPEAEQVTLSQQIAKFTRYACNRLKPLGVYVSASVYGGVIWSSVDAAAVGQDYSEMSKYLDYICPMIYASHYANGYAGLKIPNNNPYDLVYNELEGSNKKLNKLKRQQDTVAECRPWLQSFSASWVSSYEYTPEVIREQVKACYDLDVYTWFYWNAAGSYDKESFLTKEAEKLENEARRKALEAAENSAAEPTNAPSN